MAKIAQAELDKRRANLRRELEDTWPGVDWAVLGPRHLEALEWGTDLYSPRIMIVGALTVPLLNSGQPVTFYGHTDITLAKATSMRLGKLARLAAGVVTDQIQTSVLGWTAGQKPTATITPDRAREAIRLVAMAKNNKTAKQT